MAIHILKKKTTESGDYQRVDFHLECCNYVYLAVRFQLD